MYILIDMRPLAEGNASNGEFFCIDFFHALFRNNADDIFYLWTTGETELPSQFRFDDFKNVRRIHTAITSSRLHFLTRFFGYPFLDDLVETLAMKNGHLPWVAKFDAAFFSSPFPLLLEENCYSVFFSTHFRPLHFPKQYDPSHLKYQKKRWYSKLFDRTDMIITPSQFHTAEIVDQYKSDHEEKLFPVSMGFTEDELRYSVPQEDKFQDHIAEGETLESLSDGFEGQGLWDSLPEHYVLARADGETIESVIQGYELLSARFPEKNMALVILENQEGEYVHLRKGTKIASFFPDSTIDRSVLFSKASVFVDTSLYDTTGKNVLAALRCSTPVLACEYGVFPELFKNKNLYCDPFSPVSLYKSLKNIIHQPNQDDLFALAQKPEFSWDDISLKIMHELRMELERRELEE